MSKLILKVLTPEEEVINEEVDMVNIATTEGILGIMPNHTGLMAKVVPGELEIKKTGKTDHLAVGYGFLQVSQNNLIVMADLATKAADIDERAVEEAKKRAEQALSQKMTDEEQATALAVLEKSIAQLKIKRRHRSGI